MQALRILLAMANVTDDLGLFTGHMPGRHALDGLLAAFEEIDTNTNEVTVRENLRAKINKFLPARGTTWGLTLARAAGGLGSTGH